MSLPERWAPDQQVIAKVKATGSNGMPLSGDAKVTLSAVDSGVLSITGYEVADPHQFFYGQRKYQGNITDMYDQVMTSLLADKVGIKWGGDAELNRGGEKPQSEVQIVSLFSGLINLKNGRANIPLALPVFDGELTLTAVAFDKQSVATAKQSITVSSPAVLQVSLPKFMAMDDSSEMSIDISNVSDTTLDGDFKLDVSGKLIAQNIKQKLVFKNQGKKRHYILVYRR